MSKSKCIVYIQIAHRESSPRDVKGTCEIVFRDNLLLD